MTQQKTDDMQPPPATTWKKILCVRMDNMGDLLMTEPAIRALRNDDPARTVHLLCTPASMALQELMPCADAFIAAAPFWREANVSHSNERIQEMIHLISCGNYDGAIIFNVYSQSPFPMAMLCHMAGIPCIAAFAKENPYGLISHWIPDPEPLFTIRHEVERQLALVDALGFRADDDHIRIHISGEVMTRVEERTEILTEGQPFLLLHPGASEERRLYPAPLFAKAAGMIRRRTGYKVLLTGTPAETTLLRRIMSEAGEGVMEAGRFTMHELAALIAIAPVLVSNNTGPVHLAAATGTPVVVTYARTNPQHLPWRNPSIVLPFDIPQHMRSRNSIIAFAHASSFGETVDLPRPEDLVRGVTDLLLQDTFPRTLQRIRA